MNLCPKCNKWEVEEGEKYCLSCRNRKSNVLVKVGVAAAVVFIVVTILLRKKKE